MAILIVRLADGRSGSIALPEGGNARDHLDAFLERHEPFVWQWVELHTGEFVRYDHIVAVRAGE